MILWDLICVAFGTATARMLGHLIGSDAYGRPGGTFAASGVMFLSFLVIGIGAFVGATISRRSGQEAAKVMPISKIFGTAYLIWSLYYCGKALLMLAGVVSPGGKPGIFVQWFFQ